MSFFWTGAGDGECPVDTTFCFMWNSFANMIINILRLCLPIRKFTRLQVSTSVIGVFLVGSLCVPSCICGLPRAKLTLCRVVAASVIRLATLVVLSNAADQTSNITSRLFSPANLYRMLVKETRVVYAHVYCGRDIHRYLWRLCREPRTSLQTPML